MARRYLTFQYTPQAKASLASNPEDRSQGVSKLLEQANCKLLDYYYFLDSTTASFFGKLLTM